MARGWCCEKCGEWHRGDTPPATIIGDPKELGYYINLVLYERREKGRPDRDFCKKCQREVLAALLVAWLEGESDGFES